MKKYVKRKKNFLHKEKHGHLIMDAELLEKALMK